MSTLPAELRVLLLSAQGGDLVLPAGAVAEILRAEGVVPAPAGRPGWLIGTLDWRGRQVPVTRLGESEVAGGGAARRNHVVVCFAPGGEARLPFLAIESPNLPHMVSVRPGDLGPEPNQGTQPPLFAGRPLRLNGRSAWLLDLAAMEQALLA